MAPLVENEGSQLTEDDIFELLVARLRQREEHSVAAASLHKKLEAKVANLTEENKALKDELTTYGTQLQKKTLESRTYRSQINNWKAKLGKFKDFLNILGTDYQTLCGESVQLKATRSVLDREGRELRGSIDDIKAQISTATDIVGQKRSHLLESENIINALRNDLKHSEEKIKFTESQLLEEKKRVTTLETYIHSHSHIQEKQLEFIRTDQLGTNRKMDSVFEAMAKLWESSQTTIRSILSPTIDQCLLAVNTLSEKESSNQLDIQQFMDIVHEFTSRMDKAVVQLTRDIKKSSETNTNTAIYFKDQLQNIDHRFGPDCDLFKQLTENKEACGNLHEKLELIGPKFGTVNASIQDLGEKKMSLMQQMEALGRDLSQTRIPQKEPSPEDGNDRTAELESRLGKMFQELAMAQETLQAKDSENENTKHSLLDVTKTFQEVEARATQYECEVATLQRKIQSIESKVREELNRASVISRDQTRAKFEQQLHRIVKEKADTEKGLQKTKELLATAQQSQFQNDVSAEQCQKEMESLLLAKEQQIEALRSSSNEGASKLETQEAEINRFRELEDFNFAQQGLLQQQINEANQKTATLEAEIVSRASNMDRERLQELEGKLDTLQAELSRKEEERSSIQKELSDANTAKLTLESGKTKAKGEIHALLLRVQDSERWMKNVKEKLERFGISTSTEPFPETWNKLEMLLQSAIASGFPDASADNSLQQVSCTPNTTMVSTPRKVCESLSQFVQTTELIYRTQNIPRSTYSSPEGRERFRPGMAGTAVDTVPESQLSSNIIPFSSFQKRFSPVHCSSPNSDTGDFAKILTQTPQKEYPVKEADSPGKENERGLSSSSGTKKDASFLSSGNNTSAGQTKNGKKPGKQPPGASLTVDDADESRDLEYTGDKHKAVTFEDQDAHNGSKRRMPESSHGAVQERTSERLPNERRPALLNRRTYSRFRQTSSREYENISVQKDAPPSENMRADRELPYDNKSKRARMSSYSKDIYGGSDHVERRASPTSIASGSSRQNTSNDNRSSQRRAARGQKRPGRKTRGERYSARFSQDNNGAR